MERKSSFRSFDSIKAKRKKPVITEKKAKKKKIPKRNWTLLLFVLIPIFIIFSIFCVTRTLTKLKVVKMFQTGRYLVLFQNNSEIRPSGGFIGSFAIVKFKNYKISKIDFNSNIMKIDKAFVADHFIPPPEPIAKISGGSWAMRDSNFLVSFPESAQKVEWFYNQETGDSVDGVIALNASVLRDLLKISGPITIGDNIVINTNNFYTELTKQIEVEYYNSTENQQANEPKAIIKTMMPEVFRRIGSMNKFKLAQLVWRNLSQKEIQFYSHNSEIQQSILDLNLGGAVKDTLKDYLQVNVSNIGGSKSSDNVKEGLEYKVTESEGKFLADLTVSRTHNGDGVWPDGINKSWVKILVPEGSVLKTATLDDSDITAKVESGVESNKTFFATWVIVPPTKTAVLHLTYTLPISLDDYELMVQKQSGNSGDLLRVTRESKLLFNGVLNKDIVVK